MWPPRQVIEPIRQQDRGRHSFAISDSNMVPFRHTSAFPLIGKIWTENVYYDGCRQPTGHLGVRVFGLISISGTKHSVREAKTYVILNLFCPPRMVPPLYPGVCHRLADLRCIPDNALNSSAGIENT